MSKFVYILHSYCEFPMKKLCTLVGWGNGHNTNAAIL